MLKNISVRAKLFVLLILPVAALIALAAGNALEKYQTMRAMDMAVSVVDLSSASSALIHELQKERGLSAGFVARRSLCRGIAGPAQTDRGSPAGHGRKNGCFQRGQSHGRGQCPIRPADGKTCIPEKSALAHRRL